MLPSPSVALVKKGRRLLGERITLPSGKKLYLAIKSNRDIIHAGRPSLTAAVQEGVAAWSLDHDTVIRERTMGVRYLGVKERETGTIWLTALAAFEDRQFYRALNLTRSGRSVERCVLFQHFVRRQGEIKKL